MYTTILDRSERSGALFMCSALKTMWTDSEREGSVRQRLDSVLRQAIVRMVLPPGRALSEKELADLFDISRQPVREAFTRLSEVGLIEVRPQRGTYVVGISRQAVLEARFVREAVEVAVAREAATHGVTGQLLDELSELLERQRRCIGPNDYARFYELDEAFHRGLPFVVGHATAWRDTDGDKAQLDPC